MTYSIWLFILITTISLFETAFGQRANEKMALSKTSSLLKPFDGDNTQFQIYKPPFRYDPDAAAAHIKSIDLRKPVIYPNEQLNHSIPELKILDRYLGGTNGAGGGGGVACLKDPTQPLSPQNIKNLLTYDFWEWELGNNPMVGAGYIQPKKNESVEKYVQRILLENEALRTTKFELVLQEAVNQVLFNLNKNSERLSHQTTGYTNDRGIFFSNEDEVVERYGCVYVQLAWRSPVFDSNSYKIIFNRDLYDLLGVTDPFGFQDVTRTINQASLILHEALYLIGARLNQHPNSLAVRFRRELFFS